MNTLPALATPPRNTVLASGLVSLPSSFGFASLPLQERLSLAVIDDGDQLGPLSPQVHEGDRGITAAWGRLQGTKVGGVGGGL